MSELVLVIVIVVVGIVLAAAISLRAGKILPSGNAASGKAAPVAPAPAPKPTTAPSTPATRAAVLTGEPSPAGPQALQPIEIFTKLFDLALGKASPASAVTAAHPEVAAAIGAALQDAATQQCFE